MKLYIFGNPDHPQDNAAYEIIEKLLQDLPEIIPVFIKPNQDLPFENEKIVHLLDTVEGIDKPMLLTEEQLGHIKKGKRITAHDFDLGFQLKYLKKLGKINKVNIIGIPLTSETDYNSIHSICKKLVAQDMQGS